MTVFPNQPPDRESKKLDNFGKHIFTSSSSALRSVNTSCYLGGYTHNVWDTVASVISNILKECKKMLEQAVKEGRDAAKFTIRFGLDTTDGVG